MEYSAGRLISIHSLRWWWPQMKLKSKSLPTGQCHMQNVKLLAQYHPCIIICYSVYFWLIRSFTDPAFTGSIFVCGPLHHHVVYLTGSFPFHDHFSEGQNGKQISITVFGWNYLIITCFKVAENSFQYFPRLRVWWVILTTLYQLMPKENIKPGLRNNKVDKVMTKTFTLVLRQTAKLQNCGQITKPNFHQIDATLMTCRFVLKQLNHLLSISTHDSFTRAHATEISSSWSNDLIV